MKTAKDPCLQGVPGGCPPRQVFTGPVEEGRVPGTGLMEDMARYSLEEYRRLGLSADEILRLFRNPSNRLLHSMYRMKGESYVRALASGGFGETESGGRR